MEPQPSITGLSRWSLPILQCYVEQNNISIPNQPTHILRAIRGYSTWSIDRLRETVARHNIPISRQESRTRQDYKNAIHELTKRSERDLISYVRENDIKLVYPIKYIKKDYINAIRAEESKFKNLRLKTKRDLERIASAKGI